MRIVLFALATALVAGAVLAPVASAGLPDVPEVQEPDCYMIYNEWDLVVVTVYQYSSCSYGVKPNFDIVGP